MLKILSKSTVLGPQGFVSTYTVEISYEDRKRKVEFVDNTDADDAELTRQLTALHKHVLAELKSWKNIEFRVNVA